MGVIQRQGFKTSIISYIGVAIGVLSTVFIYPSALEIIGLFRSLFDASVIVGIVVMMGSSVSAVRFFPKYQDQSTGHQGLLSWLLMVSGLGFVIFLLAYPLVKHWMIDFIFDNDNKQYADLVIYILPLTFLLALINLLSRYISNFKRIAIPAIFDQLAIKITLPLIVLMYLSGWIDVQGVFLWIVASFAFSAFGLIYYLYYLGEWKLTRPLILKDKAGLKAYGHYAWYGLLAGIGSQIAFRIDGLMVSAMIRFQATGIYSISWALSEIISKPMKSLATIAAPLIAYELERKNMAEVENIYRKSALNMTIIGAGVFLLIWTVLPYIFELMPETELMREGTYVVFFLGLAQVWDMMTGVNNEIISYSKYYRFTLFLILFLAVVNIAANLLLIPMYGLAGAALSTCISMFLFNLVKLIFIKIKFNIHPFSVMFIPALGFCIAAWLITGILPDTDHNILNLFYKSAVFSSLYGFAIWKFKISSDINNWITLGWKQVVAGYGKLMK